MRAALTKEDWASAAVLFGDRGAARLHAHGLSIDELTVRPGGEMHALAALALHGQPFGFTWEDVDAIYRIMGAAEDPSRWYGATTVEDRAAVEHAASRAAARIAALLPPREAPP